LNKPTIAISYHPKIDALMADTGQAKYCLQMSNFDLEILKERFIELEANSTAVKQQLAKRTKEYRDALEEQYEQLFSKF
jgi:polysaccharide pyruvyl transferase WcaK-like protein